jgi:hypothetical protein
MNSFKATSKNNPCESCGDTKGKCRTDTNTDDFILCMSTTDKHSTPDGWVFAGMDKSQGIWGMLIRDNRQQNPEFEEQRNAREQARKLQYERDEAARISKLPKSEQRDREYRWKALKNGLKPAHREDLLQRGLTDECIKIAGIYSDSRGYAFPIRDFGGLMVGAQIKRADGAYVWDKSGTNQLSETGQLPLATWISTQEPEYIVLVEGTGVKPFLAARDRFRNSLVVGASGGNFLASFKQLAQILEMYPHQKVLLMPDAGSVMNKHVVDTYARTHQYLKSIGRETHVGWWGQTTKEAGDIDELSSDLIIQIISWDKFDRYCKQAPKILGSITRFKDLAHRKRSRVTPELTHIDRRADETYRDKSELEDALSRSIADPSIKAVLDISAPGSGKSTVIGSVRSVIGIDTHMYVHSQHRNPTTEQVETGYSDVPSRHDGLYINPDRTTPLGSPWLQTSQPSGQSWKQTPSNCDLTVEQRTWRETGHADIDGKNPICGLCPHNAVCHITSGDGYGYKHQRNSALMQSRIRISPMSLPNPANHDYSRTLTVWDDQEQIITRSISATEAQVDATISQILLADTQLAVDLEPIFSRVKAKLNEIARFGFATHSLIGGIEIDDIADKLHRASAILSPDVSKLKLSDSPDKLTAIEKFGFTVTRDSITLDKITPNWLVGILEIMSGKVVGTVHTKGQSIIVTQKDNYHQTIAAKSALTLVMNATKSREDLALELGILPEQIKVISQPMPSFANLTIYMVGSMGNPTSQRADSKNTQISALGSGLAQRHGNCSVIDKIKDCADRGLWFRDSVGSNAYKMDNALLLVGAPTRNLGALSRLFTCLTGVPTEADSKNPDFLAYVRRDVAANVIQAVGRLRAQHRPGAELSVYIVCDREDFPISEMMAAYPGATLKAVAAEDITIDAVGSRSQLRIRMAQLIMDNPNITRVEAAMSMSVSKSTITAMFKEFGHNFKEGSSLLYKALHSKLDLLDSQLGDWAKLLDVDVIEHVEMVLDSPNTTIEDKAAEVAAVVNALNSHQITALFDAIGETKTEFLIELLRFGLALSIPIPEL